MPKSALASTETSYDFFSKYIWRQTQKKKICHHWFWFLKTKFRFPQARFWGLRELWGLGLKVWVRRKSPCAFHWLSWCKFPVSLANLYLKPRAIGGSILYRSKSYYILAKFSGVFSLLKFKCFRTKSVNSQNIHKVLFSFHRCQNFSHPCWSKQTHKQGNWNSFKFVPVRKNIGFIKPSNYGSFTAELELWQFVYKIYLNKMLLKSAYLN